MLCTTLRERLVDEAWALYGGDSQGDDTAAAWKDILAAWRAVAYTMTAIHPTMNQRVDFRAYISQLCRCVC
eukprot:3011020-Rhodomonas_salina.3